MFCVWNLAFRLKMQIQGTLFPTSLKTTVVSAGTFLLFCLFANIVAFYFRLLANINRARLSIMERPEEGGWGFGMSQL